MDRVSRQPHVELPLAPWLFLRRSLLLVPEVVVLVVGLALSLVPGIAPWALLPGLLAIVWFGLRMALLAAARRALQRADYPTSARLIQQALWFYPASADAWTLRGGLALARGQSEEAVEALQRATQLFPHHGRLHALLSGAFLATGEPVAAREQAQLALQFGPNDPIAQLHMAEALKALGDPSNAAEEYLRRGIALSQSAEEGATLRCALAALLCEYGRISEARLLVNELVRLVAQAPAQARASLHFYLGECYRHLGDGEAAREHFRTSQQLDPHGRYAASAWREALAIKEAA